MTVQIDCVETDITFASATVSPSLWAETWAQECRGSCEGLHWVPGSAKPRPGPGRACCAANLAHRVDTATKGFGCTLCISIHSYFVEQTAFLKSKVMAFCQEMFISLLTAFYGQYVGPGLQLDVASWFQIVDASHLRRILYLDILGEPLEKSVTVRDLILCTFWHWILK